MGVGGNKAHELLITIDCAFWNSANLNRSGWCRQGFAVGLKSFDYVAVWSLRPGWCFRLWLQSDFIAVVALFFADMFCYTIIRMALQQHIENWQSIGGVVGGVGDMQKPHRRRSRSSSIEKECHEMEYLLVNLTKAHCCKFVLNLSAPLHLWTPMLLFPFHVHWIYFAIDQEMVG